MISWRTQSLILIVAILFATPRRGHAQAPKSLVVGIDGLSPYALVETELPNLQRLIDGSFAIGYQGSWTPHAYAGGVLGEPSQQPTVSGPGWSSILTGVWADQHGVTNNGFFGSDYDSNPTFFETLEEQIPAFYSASVARWNPIDTYIIDSVDDQNSSMDYRTSPNSDLDVAITAAGRIAQLASERPAAIFVHFDDVDGAGHGTGLHSHNYADVAATTDQYLGFLLQAIRDRANFDSEAWQIMVTSDHGHRPGGGHGGQTALERFIPFLIAEPGDGGGFLRSATNRASMVDAAASVLDHLGIGIPPNVVGVSRVNAGSSPPAASLRDGLVAHLRLDGAATSGLAGIDAEVIGQVDFSAGRFGEAAFVESYGDGHITLVEDLAATFGGEGDFSMSLWVRHEGFSSDPAFLSNKNWNSGANTGINLAMNPHDTLDFNTKGSNGDREDLHAFKALQPGAWQHVAFTVDRDGATSLFVNGILAGQIETTSAGSFDGGLPWVLLNDGTGDYESGAATENLGVDEFAAWDRLLSLDEILALSEMPIQPTGDFDDSGTLDALDIDTLVAAIATEASLVFDVNGDRQVDLADLEEWLALAGLQNLPSGQSYLLGDANLDGYVDGLDFLAWNASKFSNIAAWTAGDFNADGAVDGLDFILWNENKFQDNFAATVPDSCSGLVLLLMILVGNLRQVRLA